MTAIFRRFGLTVGVVVAGLMVAVIAVAVLAPALLTGTDPTASDPLSAQLAPSLHHVFGTDQLGRDVFTRVIYGARYSLLIGIAATALAILVGTPLGVLAGLSRGKFDELISRFLDVVSSFPDLLLALVLISFTGPGTTNLIIALGVASTPRFARVVRGQTLVVGESGWVEQARMFGLTRLTLVRRHVLPHAIAQVPILATIGLATAILGAAGLSFLGMGPQPPTPEWGAMLAEGRNYLRNAWWIAVLPGVAITATVIAVSAVGRHWQQRFEARAS